MLKNCLLMLLMALGAPAQKKKVPHAVCVDGFPVVVVRKLPRMKDGHGTIVYLWRKGVYVHYRGWSVMRNATVSDFSEPCPWPAKDRSLLSR